MGYQYYPLSRVFQFPVYAGPADYEAKTGRKAPDYDPLQPLKSWEDPAGGGAYLALKGNDSTELTGFALRPEFAKRVNFAGVATLPKYVIPDTDATYTVLGLTPPQKVNKEYLSTREQANEVAGLLRRTPADVVEANANLKYDWGGEQRRIYAIKWSGNASLIVGTLLKAMYRNGVGYPGHFDFSTPTPMWTTDNLPTFDQPVPVPIRPLDANERLVIRNPFVGVEVEVAVAASTAPEAPAAVSDPDISELVVLVANLVERVTSLEARLSA